MTRTICLLAYLLWAWSAISFAAAENAPLQLKLQKSNQLTVQNLTGGGYEIVTVGQDPFVELQPFDVSQTTESHVVLSFEYFCPEGVNGLDVYYGPPIHARKHFAAGKLDKCQSWQPYAIDLVTQSGGKWNRQQNFLRLDLGGKSGVKLRIRNLQLRPYSANENRSKAEREAELTFKLAQQSRVNAFYEKNFDYEIESVIVSEREITIGGRTRSPTNARLIEIRPHISAADTFTNEHGDFILEDQNGVQDVAALNTGASFNVRLPREVEGYDRSTSRWAVAEPTDAERWRLLSHWKYATDLSTANRRVLPRQVPKGIKGMGGVSPQFPLEELVELGVHNITVNISLTSLLDAKPLPGGRPIQSGGKTWFANDKRLAGYDRLIEFAAENDIVVSAILLVPFSNSEFSKLIIHPEADRAGHYAMPNFTSAEGVAAYEAVLKLLASRYSGDANSKGRVSNWIVHNEVGYGWEWTNMGRQPPMLYMDHYLRSLRLVHNVVRRHDTHARVFISLTHHWNTPDDPSWRSYSNLKLIERLIESSRLEGDFAWGVAYHPYPQNLRKPDAWNDTRLTNEFSTPLITPKNIAVLDRWMQQPAMKDASGNPRAVLLSEQGFNSPDYSEESQRLQAAGLVYMWRNMQGLRSIEAFHYHRWVDHPNEGGLLLGIRKLPSGGKPYGEKKFAWEIYKSLDTPNMGVTTQFADEIIGN